MSLCFEPCQYSKYYGRNDTERKSNSCSWLLFWKPYSAEKFLKLESLIVVAKRNDWHATGTDLGLRRCYDMQHLEAIQYIVMTVVIVQTNDGVQMDDGVSNETHYRRPNRRRPTHLTHTVLGQSVRDDHLRRSF
uniref:Uncharacterized protein n=1 Tax=Angiostrongylus cantonensis TaxID=6313 RepID=A0A0K0CTL0_ANGCA